MSRLLRKKQDKKLTHHTILYKKHPCLSVPIRGRKKLRVD